MSLKPEACFLLKALSAYTYKCPAQLQGNNSDIMSKKYIVPLEAFDSHSTCQSKAPLRYRLSEHKVKNFSASQAFHYPHHLSTEEESIPFPLIIFLH